MFNFRFGWMVRMVIGRLAALSGSKLGLGQRSRRWVLNMRPVKTMRPPVFMDLSHLAGNP